MTDSLVPVAVACPCPGTPHSDGDTVFLAPEISYKGGELAEALMVRSWSKYDTRSARPENWETTESLIIQAGLREIFILEGVQDWTFTDEEGQKIDVSEAAIRSLLLKSHRIARPVGEKANELYASAVIDPLVKRLSKLSQSSRRPASTSTSANGQSSAKRPKQPGPSSTSTTAKEPQPA